MLLNFYPGLFSLTDILRIESFPPTYARSITEKLNVYIYEAHNNLPAMFLARRVQIVILILHKSYPCTEVSLCKQYAN